MMYNSNKLAGNDINKPFVSVITPVFNLNAILHETADCIINQSLQQFEWIIVDDGSQSTETKNILDHLVQKDSRIQVIKHDSNLGLPAARNTGVKHSQANFIFFIDGDDLIDQTFLEKAFLILVQNENFAFVNSYVKGFGAQEYKWTGGFHESELFLKENRNTSCFMARREVFDAVMFDETMRNGCEDWDFWLNAASNNFWGYTIPEFLFFYRRNTENKWTSLNGKKSLAVIQKGLYEKYNARLNGNFPGISFPDYSFGDIMPFINEQPIINRKTSKHFICIFPWLQVGGADQFNINLLQGLKNKGWQITIITTLKDEHPWEDKFRTITPDIFHIANLGSSSQYPVILEYLVATRNPKLIFFSHSMYGYYILPFLKSRFPNLPVIDFLHCDDKNWYNGGYPRFSAKFESYIDQTFVTSNALRQISLSYGSVPEKTHVCYINVDTNNIRRNLQNRSVTRKALGIDDDVMVILYAARLTEQKQPKVLVQTLYKLQQNFTNFHFIIIGDGPDRHIIQTAINDKKLTGKVTYLKSQPHHVVMEYMDASDIFFLPSLYEGIALTFFEAMAKNLAIVGADVGGQSELVLNNCGVLVSQQNPESDTINYYHVLANLLSNPGLVKEMGENARKRVVESFDLTSMVNQVDECFMNISAQTQNRKANESAYLLLLNKIMNLEEERLEFLELSNSKFGRLISKYKKPYRKAKQVYHNVKDILKKGI